MCGVMAPLMVLSAYHRYHERAERALDKSDKKREALDKLDKWREGRAVTPSSTEVSKVRRWQQVGSYGERGRVQTREEGERGGQGRGQ